MDISYIIAAAAIDIFWIVACLITRGIDSVDPYSLTLATYTVSVKEAYNGHISLPRAAFS